LSKGFLTDPQTAAPALSTRARLADLDVRLINGRAVDADLHRRSVTVHAGGSVPFDVLVVATGSTPRTIPGLESRDGVYLLRTAADAAAIRSAAAEAVHVVVVGGGFIGAEVAWTMHAVGKQVTVVEPLPCLMIRGLGPRIGEAVTRRHAAAGIDLRPGAGVAEIEGDRRVASVVLTDGSRLAAELVVLGLGTVPETAWLADAGLDLRDGVVCDERLRAREAEGVYAGDDVARWWHPGYGRTCASSTGRMQWTRHLSWRRTSRGRRRCTTRCPTCGPSSWGGRLQVVGRIRPQDDVRVVHGDLAGDFVAVTGGSEPRAVAGFGAVGPLVRARKLLAGRAGWEEFLASG
jgi:3-phenylpropionate/trans-cinnamate dioxygenase ferredoxin reductase subunit